MSLVLGHINLMSRILLHTNTVTQTKSEPESGVNILLHWHTPSGPDERPVDFKTESILDFTKTGVMRRNILNMIFYVKYSPVLRVVAAPAPTERARERGATVDTRPRARPHLSRYNTTFIDCVVSEVNHKCVLFLVQQTN